MAPKQARREVPQAMSPRPRKLSEVTGTRKRPPDVVFASLCKRPECVWVSHEDIVAGL
jgi:hypothetical protein